MPAPGEPGSETWPRGDQWKTGGAPVRDHRKLRLRNESGIFGTGNGGPTIGDKRPGDNLYTSSTIAFDVSTGAIRGYFQYHPTIPGIMMKSPRLYWWIISATDEQSKGWSTWRATAMCGSSTEAPRATGVTSVMSKASRTFTRMCYESIDPDTGRPDVDPEHKPGTGKRADFCPGTHGGKNWPPIAFSPKPA